MVALFPKGGLMMWLRIGLAVALLSPLFFAQADPGAAGQANAGQMGERADSGWVAQTRRVQVSCPLGDEWREITYWRNNLGMEFVKIPAGEFWMGDTLTPEKAAEKWGGGQAEGFRRALPRHKVRITRPFHIGATEVTRAQFAAFVNDTGYQTDAEKLGKAVVVFGGKIGWVEGANWRDPWFQQQDNHPAVCVSWNDAAAFCEWLSKREGRKVRLPTEAEWECAARAGSETTWYWGDEEGGAQGRVNAADEEEKISLGQKFPLLRDGWAQTSPVASFKPNGFGLYDVIGNAWEWCQDWFAPDYYQQSPLEDPAGPAHGDKRVVRGGSWLGTPRYCRTAYRLMYTPDSRSVLNGFRVVVEAAP